MAQECWRVLCASGSLCLRTATCENDVAIPRFLARLSDSEFNRGIAELRAHIVDIDSNAAVTEEIDWFVFTKRA